MIQPTTELWIPTKNVISSMMAGQLEEALPSIEERPSEGQIASIIRCLRGGMTGLLNSERKAVTNAVMKQLKAINRV